MGIGVDTDRERDMNSDVAVTVIWGSFKGL